MNIKVLGIDLGKTVCSLAAPASIVPLDQKPTMH